MGLTRWARVGDRKGARVGGGRAKKNALLRSMGLPTRLMPDPE